jgi:hypothetical protein
MDFEPVDLNRKMCQIGIRPFVDQLESLQQLRIHKHRSRCSVAYLIREALDQYIERETAHRHSWEK